MTLEQGQLYIQLKQIIKVIYKIIQNKYKGKEVTVSKQNSDQQSIKKTYAEHKETNKMITSFDLEN
jgi:hypothetical protein